MYLNFLSLKLENGLKKTRSKRPWDQIWICQISCNSFYFLQDIIDHFGIPNSSVTRQTFPKNDQFLLPDKQFRFSENLVCFVFLLPLFWDSPLCPATDKLPVQRSCHRFSFLNLPITKYSKDCFRSCKGIKRSKSSCCA